MLEKAVEHGCGLVRQQQPAVRGAVGRQAAAHAERIVQHALHLGAHQVQDVGAVQDRQRAGLVDARAQVVQDRLRQRHQRGRREIRVPQVQHARAQRELPVLLADIAELFQRVQAAPHRRARELGALCHLRDRQRALALGKRFQHGQPARQRQHEIGIAGKAAEQVGLGPGNADGVGLGMAKTDGAEDIHGRLGVVYGRSIIAQC
ncbi:protein of unknown function (plasmid) [Cupriavidus taiwanensis]|uniref:Uncharacterized protein n=1 Tax=Cupriavidus taiwanensis TaxID=164546 RepID=A0A9Q7V291_9BURK|nr:protein of unknown function [Cupriavidus taiwanensis]